jgi:hypothetical protein
MAKFNAKESAVALLNRPAAKDRADFAARAAACHLLASHPWTPGFDLVAVWPAHLHEFDRLAPEDHRALAAAILEAEAARLKLAA